MSSSRGTAIITYGRSLMAVVVARSLASRGVRVISCDSVGMTAASFSKYTSDNFVHADPATSEDNYLDDLINHIKRLKPEGSDPFVLMPVFRDAKLLSRHRDRFDGLIELAAPPYEAINQVDPKHHLVNTLESLNVVSPKTWHLTDQRALDRAVSELKLPALIKAVDEVGGRGIEFFETREELKQRACARMEQEVPPPVVQEAVDGEDYCLGVLYQNGQRIAHMAYHNLQTVPTSGGAGAMRETVDDAPFLEAADKVMAAANWTGIAEIDFMWSGRPGDPAYLIEVNPRFWAGLFQSVESGVDFPWLLFQLHAYGQCAGVGSADIGTKTRIPVVWLAGALSDAFDKDDGENVDPRWQDMLDQVRTGELGAAFSSLKEKFKKVTNIDDALSQLRRKSRAADNSTSELMLSEDPATSLGVFFILSSLIRHGKLPPEVTD